MGTAARAGMGCLVVAMPPLGNPSFLAMSMVGNVAVAMPMMGDAVFPVSPVGNVGAMS